MRVLVTRPEPGASHTAERLSALGHEPVLLPLTAIAPLPTPAIAAADFDAVAVTSANALRNAAEHVIVQAARLPCFAVGDETARLAGETSFANVASADGDADDLATLMIQRLPGGSRILYLCGRLRRPTFEAALSDAGFEVAALETYETLPADYAPESLAAHLGEKTIDLALVYSAEAAIALVRLMHSETQVKLSPAAIFLCISTRVAAILSSERHKTLVASEPTEPSMLSALRDISSAEP
ncbi:MAG: uroporphyrinogen-III synthase [Rhizobiaceae bacterium]|nr:uroporphyrinogen-III synthase [Rhizobiaceae bacterium]